MKKITCGYSEKVLAQFPVDFRDWSEAKRRVWIENNLDDWYANLPKEVRKPVDDWVTRKLQEKKQKFIRELVERVQLVRMSELALFAKKYPTYLEDRIKKNLDEFYSF